MVSPHEDAQLIRARDTLHDFFYRDPGGWFTQEERVAIAVTSAALERLVNTT